MGSAIGRQRLPRSRKRGVCFVFPGLTSTSHRHQRRGQETPRGAVNGQRRASMLTPSPTSRTAM